MPCAGRSRGALRGRTPGLETRWRFDQARAIVALDGDFLDCGPQQVGVSRDWGEARRAAIARGSLLELHTANAVPGLTSAKADYPLVASQAEIAALASGLLADIEQPPAGPPPPGASPQQVWRARAAAVLRGARGSSLVVAGMAQPPEIQESVHRLNAALGNIDKTVFYTAPVVAEAETLADLATAVDRGSVQTLLMLDINPAYDAPADLDFRQRLAKIPLKIHAGLYRNESADRCDWHVPLLHPLEAWGDACAPDGTVGFLQPTIAPLYDGRSCPEILSMLTDKEPQGGLDLLRSHWQGGNSAQAFAPQWQTMLLNGFVANSALPAEHVQLVAAGARSPSPAQRADTGLDLVFRPDAGVWDGSLANNAWLQELPRPLTKLVWENVIAVSPGLAEREHLTQGEIVTLTAAGRSIEGPVWILPAQAADTVSITLGYGRTVPDMLFEGLGYDAYALRRSADPWRLRGGRLHKTGRRVTLATTQDHSTMEGHDFIRAQPIGAAAVGDRGAAGQPSLYDRAPSDGRAWGMVIDLDSCIGCNACVTACQSENNIAVVGREQVELGRESTATTKAAWMRRRRISSRCRACSARMRRARSAARWRRPCTTMRA